MFSCRSRYHQNLTKDDIRLGNLIKTSIIADTSILVGTNMIKDPKEKGRIAPVFQIF